MAAAAAAAAADSGFLHPLQLPLLRRHHSRGVQA
jgi:hypothetical protein